MKCNVKVDTVLINGYALIQYTTITWGNSRPAAASPSPADSGSP